ncbi:MAG: hypothetical protein JNL67_03190 [Planctomycetaceae bacterium]|nr:hypothetical protein [Planctomycetaceae bacterium]
MKLVFPSGIVSIATLVLLAACNTNPVGADPATKASASERPASNTSQDEGDAGSQVELDDDLAPLVDALTSKHLVVRLEAIKALSETKLEPNTPTAAKIVQILLDHRRIEFNDYEDRFVEAALRKLGPVVIAEIQRQALSSDISEVSNACEAMRSLGAEAYSDFRPFLIKMLASSVNEQQWGALYALEKTGAAGQDLLPNIQPFLTSEDFQLQIIALRALAAIGPPAWVHEAIVRDLTSNGQNVSVKSHALRALGYMAAGDPEHAVAAAKVLGGNLNEFAFMTKSRALEGLIQLEAHAAATSERIKELLRDDTGLAPQASVVHASITGEWDATIKLLVSRLRDPIEGMECLSLLRKLGPKSAAAEPEILKLTSDEDEVVALMAVETLAAMVNLNSPTDFQQATPPQRELLDRIANHLEKFSQQGEADSHHRAGVLVSQWREHGWQPTSSAPKKTEPVAGE